MSQHLEGEFQKLRCEAVLFLDEKHLLRLEMLLEGLEVDSLASLLSTNLGRWEVDSLKRRETGLTD